MNNIKLYIEGENIELNTDVQFAITRQFEELYNPTIIINDWSRTVEIPFTVNNNRVFGNIYNVDMQTISGGSGQPIVGLYFNPLLKLNFRLEYNDTQMMTGYAKMNTITKKDGNGTYNITLYGSLGKVLQEMQKITFDESKNDSEHYYIAPSETFGEATLNKTLISKCWMGGYNPNIYPALQWIGFAPNNSFNDDFDYKSWQSGSSKEVTFEEVLTASTAFRNTGVNANSVVGDGLLPKDIGEYRSYLQLPYVKMPKLWEIFQSKTEAVTGYQFELDTDWFSTGNTYFNDEVMMLKLNEQGSNATKGMTPASTYNTYRVNTVSKMPIKVSRKRLDLYNVTTNEVIQSTDLKFNSFIQLDYLYKLTFTDNWQNETPVKLYNNSGIELNILARSGNTSLNIAKYLVVSEPTSMDTSAYDDVFTLPQQTIQHSGDKILANISIKLMTSKISSIVGYGSYDLYMDFKYVYKYPEEPTEVFPFQVLTNYWRQWHIPGETGATLTSNIIELNEAKYRSGCKITFNDLWNNDYTLYDVIINYCKVHRIYIQVDDYNKKIKFIAGWNYFKNYTIDDWTDKLDMSKDYIIKPCTLENKYVLFNYKDSETKLGKEYLEKYGFDYGELNLITNYNFNTDTEKLFDKEFTSPIVYSDNNLSWNDLLNGKIRYVVPADTLVYCQDEDKKYVSNFGALYFYRGLSLFDNNQTFNFRTARISDDTDFMVLNNTYFYAQDAPSGSTGVTKYPKLDIVKDNKLITYNKPSDIYSYNQNEYTGATGVYERYWSNFMNERYNSNNKKVTCYMYIKPSDFVNFQFNKFIRIGNQLYMVNKIYDYLIAETQSTKVDLITVQDINGYKEL